MVRDFGDLFFPFLSRSFATAKDLLQCPQKVTVHLQGKPDGENTLACKEDFHKSH